MNWLMKAIVWYGDSVNKSIGYEPVAEITTSVKRSACSDCQDTQLVLCQGCHCPLPAR